MSYDGATFSQHSVLSPPLLAAIDSQHIFGSYDATPSSSQAGVDASSASHDQPSSSTSSHHRRTRSRASSATSVHNIVANANTAISSLQQNGHSGTHKRTRRGHHAQSVHSRSSSRSGPIPTNGRSAASNAYPSSAASEEPRPLTSSLRNRSSPHLDGLRSLSSAHEHSHSTGGMSAFTAPSSPLLSSAASLALAMSPVAQASAMADHLMPSDWTLDSSVPTSPHTSLSRNASDYFDPALLAQLQSQNGSSHPELRSTNGRPDPSPPMHTVLGRLSPHPTHAARSASQSGWAQHAAQMQQTAHLLGLHRLFASRSTPHLPDLDSSYLGHDFESPPPYAPRASAHETELERAADLGAPPSQHPSQNRLPSNSSSASTLLNASTSSPLDPPLPPPISIPSSAGAHTNSGPPSASIPARPSLRARSSSRGSRSGPPSPSASFYGRRGLTSLSPFPAGLEMTPSVAHVSQFSSTPASPGFAPDSDGDEDLDGALSFSSSRSKQRRDERRQTVASMDHPSRTDVSNGHGLISASLPGPSAQAQAQAILSRRRRSGSAGSARQLLRPRTPINPSVARDSTSLPQHAAGGSHGVSSEASAAPPSLPAVSDFATSIAANGNGHPNRRPAEYVAPIPSRGIIQSEIDHDDTDVASQPLSPISDSTRPDSPSSPDPTSEMSPSSPFASIRPASATEHAARTPEAKPTGAAANDDDEEFPLVLKLLLHPLRILAAVPGCIGTFWLARNAWVLATRHGHLLSPGQILITPDGTSHFWSAQLSELPVSGPLRLGRRQPGSLDFAVACLWSMSTAYHALSFTTLLLRRWLLYYSILPSLIRLVALQAICWPLVRLTVHVFGADQPLGAWVVIGTTTALSDVVSRWVTSNIADAPLDDELDEEEEEAEAENEALGYLSDSRFAKIPTRPSAAERLFYADQCPSSAAAGHSLMGDSDWDPRSGDESDAAAASFYASERERQRKQRRGGQGTRFWRAVIGGPSFAAPSRRRKKNTAANAAGGTETEMEGESDWPGYATDRTVLGATGAPTSRFGIDPSTSSGMRRRFPPTTTTSTSTTAFKDQPDHISILGRRTVLPPFPFKPSSSYRQGHTRFVYRAGVWTRERTSSRRNFHWEVAVWRNVVPIAVLAYLSMWILVFDAMRLGG
ncbi:related to Myp1 protein [Ustilago trichophora]|uniref:Related to Myp1 protein n=1 Tax=Ustilago trichophora TaxID=86804 RepID=A0A5C3EN68_9BASI|nr:related to Myp1 protein [Ustilago trichophora]